MYLKKKNNFINIIFNKRTIRAHYNYYIYVNDESALRISKGKNNRIESQTNKTAKQKMTI